MRSKMSRLRLKIPGKQATCPAFAAGIAWGELTALFPELRNSYASKSATDMVPFSGKQFASTEDAL